MKKIKASFPCRENNSTNKLITAFIQSSWVGAILIAMLPSFGDVAEADEPERWAIVIGIDNYHKLTHLSSSSKDAMQFEKVLKDRCGFKNVSLVIDQPNLPHAPASERDRIRDQARLNVHFEPLQDRIQNFIKVAEKSGVQTLVVYYSGHGCAVLNPNLPQPADLLLPAINASESKGELKNAISKNEIQSLLALADIPNKLLVLDCCHAAQPDQIPMSGKAVRIGHRGTTSTPSGASGATTAQYDSAKPKANSNSNFIVLAGSGFQQVAGEQVFTKYIVEGLGVLGDSAKDKDNSQWIEIDELFGHVQKSMSAAGGQMPSMEVISGKRDGIVMAPSIFQLDPPRSMDVYVASGKGGIVSQASVKLVFFDSDRAEPETLATDVTDQSGKAKLEYQFGSTRDRNGQFQVKVTPRGQQYRSKITSLPDFVSMPSGAGFKISLMEKRTAGSSPYDKGTAPQFPARNTGKSVLESERAVHAEPSHQEVINSISAYIEKSKQVPDICSFEKYFSEYHSLMKGLKRSDKLSVSGVTVCFPSVSYWKQNDKFRGEVLRILTAKGVVDPALIASRRTSSFLNMREPSYNEVKKATFGFIERINADVCGLVDYVEGYKTLIDTLDKSEKYEVLPGLTVCFPSKKCWDSKPSFRKKFVRVLREAFVLTK